MKQLLAGISGSQATNLPGHLPWSGGMYNTQRALIQSQKCENKQQKKAML